MVGGAFYLDWLEFAVRWTHVIVAIAWIGSSFYFIALDLGLRRHDALPKGVGGEEWQVHGGGFYHIQKYMVAPGHMPEDLTWFKWESYATWLSGAALLIVVYWLGAELYLIDPAVADLAVWQAVLLSGGSLVIGWLIYDALCKSPVGQSPTGLMLLLFVLLVAMSWGYTQIFSGRAALLHLGAFTATIMSANVFRVIIPNQHIVVGDLKAGRTPDAKYGKIAKQRSTHNNYLTLPVLFLMLSNHYPLAFASEFNWIIASLVFLMGVTIRHFFNTLHATGKGPAWTWAATAILFVIIVAISVYPILKDDQWEETAMTPRAERFAAAEHFDAAFTAIQGRCAMCHAPEPSWPGIAAPPKGVNLVTRSAVATLASDIYLQAGVTHAMPPGNLSQMEDEERALIRAWYEEGAYGEG
ncbi:urate hydroxylase PuuD [Roseicyclus sp. F158]|uniref:Urate hydroxylase PuuD n=1 Tax=Tropicimonas omnivorans TaxID=3075590 RepID=A0ABU3DL73_9RHOB|nr:urate hydroxylase PuuD [Roseicyclus sp. F158]MDT0684461.1 urate hydroxylase PuuD [Roseicyclus sp. F158]